MNMTCEVEWQGERAVFSIKGKIYEAEAAQIKEQFCALPLEKAREVLLDLGGVTYLGSSAIGNLLIFYKRLKARQATMRLVNTPEMIAGLLRDLRLDSLFPIA